MAFTVVSPPTVGAPTSPFPPGILKAIFYHLTADDDLYNAMLVCRDWRGAVSGVQHWTNKTVPLSRPSHSLPSYAQSVHITEGSMGAFLQALQRTSYPAVRTLVVDDTSVLPLKCLHLLQNVPNLTHLHLHTLPACNVSQQPDSIAQHSTALTALDITSVDIWFALTALTSLHMPHSVSLGAHASLFSDLVNLHSLHLPFTRPPLHNVRTPPPTMASLQQEREGIYADANTMKGVMDTSFLVKLPHLCDLDLSHQAFSARDVTVLARLTQLTKLVLAGCTAHDTSALTECLTSLTNLLVLDLSEQPREPEGTNHISTGVVKALHVLDKLQSLNLSGIKMRLQDTQGRAACLGSLKTLLVTKCALTNPSIIVICMMSQLVHLDISENKDLSSNAIEFVTKLRHLTHLTCGTRTSYFTPSRPFIEGLSNLRELYTTNWCIEDEEDVDAFCRLRRLQALSLAEGSFQDLSMGALHVCSDTLTKLDMTDNLDECLHPIAGFHNLRELILSCWSYKYDYDDEHDFLLDHLSSLSWYSSITNLHTLNLSHFDMPFDAIPFLAAITSLRKLDITGVDLLSYPPSRAPNSASEVSHLLSLSHLTNLRVLFAASNNLPASAVQYLAQIPNLYCLDLSDNKLGTAAELHLLTQMRDLTHLYLAGNGMEVAEGSGVDDGVIGQLGQLTRLLVLDVNGLRHLTAHQVEYLQEQMPFATIVTDV